MCLSSMLVQGPESGSAGVANATLTAEQSTSMVTAKRSTNLHYSRECSRGKNGCTGSVNWRLSGAKKGKIRTKGVIHARWNGRGKGAQGRKRKTPYPLRGTGFRRTLSISEARTTPGICDREARGRSSRRPTASRCWVPEQKKPGRPKPQTLYRRRSDPPPCYRIPSPGREASQPIRQ